MAGELSPRRRARPTGDGRVDRRRAVTMIEILVVVVVIGILLSAVLTAGSALLTRAQTKNTEAVLTVVNEALVEFEREQKANPTLANSSPYKKRYGLFPPDELEVFTPGGVPGGGGGSRAPGRAVMVPAGFQPMTFYPDPTDVAHDPNEHRDLAAMILAVELFGDSSKAILDRIPDKNRTQGVVDEDGTPLQFLDNDRNSRWSGGDHQIRYIVDDWGNPLAYFAQRDWKKGAKTAPASTNHAEWNQWSTRLIQLNRGQPVILSYGPDGAEQLTKDAMVVADDASLVGDLSTDNILSNPFNADNVFLAAELKEKLLRGVQ